MELCSLFDVRGKTSLVTGGARGIGAMISRALVVNGAHVIIVSRKAEQCAKFAAELSACGPGTAESFAADLSQESECERIAKLMSAQNRMLHILVNNSGCNWGESLATYPHKAFEKVFQLNVFGVFTLTRLLLPLMERSVKPDDPCRIINIGSINGASVSAMETYAYSSSKAALHHLTKTLASKLAPKGINVNAILPGPFYTDMTIGTFKPVEKMILQSVPTGRLGKPEDIAGAVLYLSSRASSYVSGALIPVDGGSLVSPKL
uniref:Uncharacterized protein n=1 Tax=Spongospora subterranea TaxID=70186 RepID=A0A0H5RRR9_9EUKA|eukprot:CRZ11414.1 hypothetical protein [Spongospora subterranea]